MKIDKTYVINLAHRTDRKTHMIKELARVEITNYEFFKALKPLPELIPKWNPNFLEPMPGWYKGPIEHYKIGALGCMLSHLTIIKKALQANYNYILILEDDTEFNFTKSFDSVLSEYNCILDSLDFAILYLVGNNQTQGLQHIVKDIYLTRATATTGSYILSRKGMEYIVANINNYEREIDMFYITHVQVNLPCFCIIPSLARQMASYSDIVSARVAYDLNTAR